MSNNLLQQSNFFAQDFDQSLFFFYPKQFTLDLRLDGIEVINPVNAVGGFNPTNITLDTIRTVNGSIDFKSTNVSLEFVDAKLSSFSFTPSPLSLETINTKVSNADLDIISVTLLPVIGLNKQIPTQFSSAPTADIIFIRESSLNISIAI